jgi:hypothetical protein
MKVVSFSEPEEKTGDSVLFDIYTVLHFCVGAIFYYVFAYFFPKTGVIFRLMLLLVFHTIYELKDYCLNYKIIYQDPLNILKTQRERDVVHRAVFKYFLGTKKNTFVNSVGDTIGFLVGCFAMIYILGNFSVKGIRRSIIVFAIGMICLFFFERKHIKLFFRIVQ